MTFFRDREQHPFEWTGRESKLGRWAPTVQLVGMYREGTLWFAIRLVEIHKIQPAFEEAEPSTRSTGMMRTRLSAQREVEMKVRGGTLRRLGPGLVLRIT